MSGINPNHRLKLNTFVFEKNDIDKMERSYHSNSFSTSRNGGGWFHRGISARSLFDRDIKIADMITRRQPKRGWLSAE